MKIRDRIKELRRVKASDLAPNPKNWRTHPKAQADALKGLLSEIGYADALLARELPDGSLMLVDGHLRAEATPDAEVPVLILDLTEEEADKVLATLDPLAAMAGKDQDLLASLTASIDTESEALQAMLDANSPPDPIDGLTDPDDVPEPPEEPRTQPGELIVMGAHRLMCGDSTDPDTVARLLDGEVPGMMVTDPPYGVEYDPSWRKDAGINKNPNKQGKVQNDNRASWKEAWDLFPGSVAYVWHGALHSTTVAVDLIESGLEVRAQLIWKKDRFALSRGAYHWGHEPCWYVVRTGSTADWTGDRKQSTLWDINRADDSGHGHGTQKPVECMERPMRNHGHKLIYDPFLGSGTSIIAAERTGKACYGLELDPAYCDVIVSRWEQYTGQKATRAD